MYRADIDRAAAETRFEGSRDAFLATLGTRMTVRRARAEDLDRAEELTVRTNQLNTSGRTYSHAELAQLARSPDHLLLVAELEDRYGSSGIVGLTLVEATPDRWTIRLFIMSCRVMTRGVGTVLLGHLLRRARRRCVRLLADFVPTDRNRQMLVTYKFAGFRQSGEVEGGILLEHMLERIPALPGYVALVSEEDDAS
jgi:FkbH-like protein